MDCARIDVESIAKEVADTLVGVESVVMAGSRSRDEQIPDELVAYRSDFDLIAICNPGAVFLNVKRVRPLENRLSTLAAARVTVGLLPDLLLSRSPRTTFFYELRRCGKTVWGEVLTDGIRIASAREIDSWEALVVPFNYLSQLLSAWYNLSHDGPAFKLRTLRVVLSAMDAHLLARGTYSERLDERARRFMQIAPDVPYGKQILQHWSLREELRRRKVSQLLEVEWTKARSIVRSTITHLMSERWPNRKTTEELLHEYETSDPSCLRNLQYSLLAMSDSFANRFSNLLMVNDVKRRFHVAVYHLVGLPPGGVEHQVLVDKARASIGLPDVPKDLRIVEWVLDRWRYSSPVLGL